MNTLKELERVRKRWKEAHKRKDTIMEKLWLRVGKKLKEPLESKFDLKKTREIFKK